MRRGDYAIEHRCKMTRHPRHGRGIEQIGVVFEHAGKRRVRLEHLEFEIDLTFLLRQIEKFDMESPPFRTPARRAAQSQPLESSAILLRFLIDERSLEQRRVTRIAPG